MREDRTEIKNKRKNLFLVFLPIPYSLFSILYLFPIPYLQGQTAPSINELKEKNRLVREKCIQAMEFYHKGDYSAAIRFWSEALNIDSSQVVPQKMIELARKNIETKIGPLINEVAELCAGGKYDTALKKNDELISLDPTNQKYKKLRDKLLKVTAITKQNTGASKASHVLRKGIYDYLYKEENVRLALLAARYASYLEQNSASFQKFVGLLESEYPQVAQFEKDVPGMNIIDSKLMSALNNIYDGKYNNTIIDCNDVIYLEPDNVLAYKRLGSAYWALGNKERAKSVWKSASKIAPNDEELKKFLMLK